MLLFDPENSLSDAIPHDAVPAYPSDVGTDYIGSMVFTRSESYLIAANLGGTIFFFDLERGELNVAVHGNGSRLLTPPYTDSVIFFDQDTIEIYVIPSGEREEALDFSFDHQLLFFSPGGTRLAMRGMLWNMQNGSFQVMPENERVISFSEDGSYVYSIRDGWWWVKRRTFDLELHEQVFLRTTNIENLPEYEINMSLSKLAFWSYSPEASQITAYASLFNRPWSTQTGEMLEIPEGNLELGISFDNAASLDGSVRAEISDNEVFLRNNLDGAVLGSLDVSLWGVFRLAFSPDGHYFALASSNGVIRLFGVMPPNQSEQSLWYLTPSCSVPRARI